MIKVVTEIGAIHHPAPAMLLIDQKEMSRYMQANNADRKAEDTGSIKGERPLAEAAAQGPIESKTSGRRWANTAANESAARRERKESVHRSFTPASSANGISQVTEPGAAV